MSSVSFLDNGSLCLSLSFRLLLRLGMIGNWAIGSVFVSGAWPIRVGPHGHDRTLFAIPSRRY